MSDGDAQDWLRHARADLRFARLGHNDQSIPGNLPGFHAQQPAEKALKAILVANGIEFPRTHDLQELTSILSEAGLAIPAELEHINRLTPFAVETRYPGFADPVTHSEVDRAVSIAENAIAWAAAVLGPPPAP